MKAGVLGSKQRATTKPLFFEYATDEKMLLSELAGEIQKGVYLKRIEDVSAIYIGAAIDSGQSIRQPRRGWPAF